MENLFSTSRHDSSCGSQRECFTMTTRHWTAVHTNVEPRLYTDHILKATLCEYFVWKQQLENHFNGTVTCKRANAVSVSATQASCCLIITQRQLSLTLIKTGSYSNLRKKLSFFPLIWCPLAALPQVSVIYGFPRKQPVSAAYRSYTLALLA